MNILFVLFMYSYFVFEGWTEAMSTKGSLFDSITYQDKYHWKRVFEMLSIAAATHIRFIATGSYNMIPIFWLCAISGLGLYEMVFSKIGYGKYLHNKTSLWFGLRHPKGYVNLVVFMVAGVLTIYLIVR